MLERIRDRSDDEWIEASLTEESRWALGNRTPAAPIEWRMHDSIPPTFDAYMLIRHAVHIDESISDRRRTYDDEVPEGADLDAFPDEIADLLREATEPAGADLIVPYRVVDLPANAPRIRWSAIADALGVRIEPHEDIRRVIRRAGFRSWPRWLVPTPEGEVDAASAAAIIEAISDVGSSRALFRMAWGSSDEFYDETALFRGEVSDYLEICISDTWWLAPEYSWAADRSWILHTDRDNHLTLVGGSSDLVQKLIHHPDIEGIVASADTRIRSGYEPPDSG